MNIKHCALRAKCKPKPTNFNLIFFTVNDLRPKHLTVHTIFWLSFDSLQVYWHTKILYKPN